MAGRPHDQEQRFRAKEALKYPPMIFNEAQIQAVGRGFSVACKEADIWVLSCAIMPNHVHLVTLRHAKLAEDIITHLKSRASKQLGKEGLRPDQTIWAQKSWPIFLYNDIDIKRSIYYVNQNPIKAGMAAQHWDFVRPYPF